MSENGSTTKRIMTAPSGECSRIAAKAPESTELANWLTFSVEGCIRWQRRSESEGDGLIDLAVDNAGNLTGSVTVNRGYSAAVSNAFSGGKVNSSCLASTPRS